MISRMIDGKDAFKFVVTGSPGIGKSYFLLYIMWRLVQNSPAEDPPTIVVQYKGKLALCFQGSKVFKGSIESFETQLENPNTWLLVDGMEPVFRNAKTIVFTSPNLNVYSAFLKEVLSTELFMPVWSFDELQACRCVSPHCFKLANWYLCSGTNCTRELLLQGFSLICFKNGEVGRDMSLRRRTCHQAKHNWKVGHSVNEQLRRPTMLFANPLFIFSFFHRHDWILRCHSSAEECGGKSWGSAYQ